jgi:lipoprotein Spr
LKHLTYISFLAALTLMASCGSSRNSSKIISGSQATRIEKSGNRAGKSDNDRKVANALIKEAKTWLGVPYRYGGTSKDGADCSGFIMSVFDKAANIKLPRDSRSQQQYCEAIDAKYLQPGDLVFFTGKTSGEKVSHVGMFIGDNSIIHASTSRGVIISDLSENYYQSHYYSSGRIDQITYAYTGNKPKQTTVETSAPAPVAAVATAGPTVTTTAQSSTTAADEGVTMSVKKNREEKAPRPKHTSRGTKHTTATQQTDSILPAWLD